MNMPSIQFSPSGPAKQAALMCLLSCLLGSSATAQSFNAAPAAASASASPSPYAQWEQLGPIAGAGMNMFSLADTSADSQRIYGGSLGGLIVSSDGGQSWTGTPDVSGFGVWMTLAASQTDANIVFGLDLLTGLRRTEDGGQNWTSPIIDSTPVDLVTAPGGHVYVSTHDGVWKSDDNGLSFSKVLCDVDTFGGAASSLAADGVDENHLYLHAGALGLMETNDGGLSWDFKTIPPGVGSVLVIDPLDGERLLALGTSLHLSEDGGDTWTDIGSTLVSYPQCAAFDPFDDQRIHVGISGSPPVMSVDGGATWSENFDPGLNKAGTFTRTILASANVPGRVFVGSTGGVFKSTDGGLAYERRNHGLEARATVDKVVVDPFDADHLVVKTGASAYTSDDGGWTWTESTGSGFTGFGLAADHVIPDRFYASDWAGGLWRSDDGGNSFSKSFVSDTAYCAVIATHPTIGGRIFGAGSGLLRSDDGGQTFTVVEASGWSWAVAISPANPDVMFYGTGNTIRYSHDGGLTWSPSDFAGLARNIIPDPTHPLVAYALGDSLVTSRTDDGGVTWTGLASSIGGATNAAVSLTDPGTVVFNDLYVPRAYQSSDGGMTSHAFGRLQSRIEDFASSVNGIYAGTWGSGVLIWR